MEIGRATKECVPGFSQAVLLEKAQEDSSQACAQSHLQHPCPSSPSLDQQKQLQEGGKECEKQDSETRDDKDRRGGTWTTEATGLRTPEGCSRVGVGYRPSCFDEAAAWQMSSARHPEGVWVTAHRSPSWPTLSPSLRRPSHSTHWDKFSPGLHKTTCHTVVLKILLYLSRLRTQGKLGSRSVCETRNASSQCPLDQPQCFQPRPADHAHWLLLLGSEATQRKPGFGGCKTTWG